MLTEAAVLTGPERLEIQEFVIPEIGPDEAILEVESCGICGSDMDPFLHGGARTGGPRIIKTPVILGHEMVGRISRVGREAQQRWKVAEGDRVVVERWLPCGKCQACQGGQFPYCYRQMEGEYLFYGGTPTSVRPSLWGGFARHMYLHPSSLVHRVASEPPAGVYSMFLPLGNAVSWVQHAGQLGLGERILIEGPGPIGLMCVMVARAAGAQTIIVSGASGDERRLQLARDLGATHTLDSTVVDVAERCRELCDGGVDVVVDVTNAHTSAPVIVAVGSVRPNGRVVLASGHGPAGGDGQIANQIQDKTLTVVGVRGRSRKAAAIALDLLADAEWSTTLKRLCDPVVALSDIADGFAALQRGDALHASMSLFAG